MTFIQKPLAQAIYTKAKNDSAISAVVGTKVSFSRMEQGTQAPYLVFDFINNIKNRDSSDTWEQTLIEFRLISDKNGSTEINNLIDAVISCFDDVILSVSGFTSIKFNRTNDFFNPTFTNGWDKRIRYEVEFQQN